METINKTTDKILMRLLKEPFARHTATSLAKSLNITRQGLWKSLNKLAKNKLVILESIGNTTKSVVNVRIQWNQVTIKTLSLLLTKESSDYERWRVNFLELESYSGFVILFGSIIHMPKEADDIDILAIVTNNSFKQINDAISRIQKTQIKKIHLIDLTEEEFKQEIEKQNKAYLDALKKGIVLFGHDNYIKFIKGIRRA